MAILSVDDEYPLESQATGFVILNALRSLHWDLSGIDSDESIITQALADLVSHESNIIRESAATCLGYVSPLAFLELVRMNLQNGVISKNSELLDEYKQGIENAGLRLEEVYYGDMCPGMLSYLDEDKDLLTNEYKKMYSKIQPIVSVFPLNQSIERLIDILESLNPQDSSKEDGMDLCTLPLPFDD